MIFFTFTCKLPHFSVDTRTSKQARAFPDSSPRERTIVLRVKIYDTHTKRPGSSAKEQVANGSFIKHKSGIYTVGQKDTSPPSGSRKEKSQGATPKVGEQLNREKRKPGGRAHAQRKADPGTLPVGENLACRWNYHDRRVLSKLHPWAVGKINKQERAVLCYTLKLMQWNQEAEQPCIAPRGKMGNLCTYSRLLSICFYTKEDHLRNHL